MKNCRNFVELLAAASGGARAAYHEVLDEWRPDEPPTTILFSALGNQIAEEFNCADTETNNRVFSLIEQAMQSNDQRLTTAVATGLIEALVNRAVQSAGLWNEMAPLLGPKSLHHAEAWLSS